ncbi:hypothetical protein A3D81_01705 [Candidatus Curtissbacteria bacterium RIFCSPHIGHO2_02_FULL_40_17]|uniref:Mannosylglycerate hydrolase MGH1-like glycoside hydrolase domain-containing protein n=4 Tax=Candidatus Curtissiibacteriota TaxID=1752717 RepID=A0A1F5GH21_9BACT|nr:MAG: hypothetical protein A2693_03465 [Candidatus Curtissbacteria bacterium RIFCSPHIGHO2_01_FULL_40_12]OGD91171.1 MAG: hypothetical protein A3D81_01705 [Candidatus Curtissbacteria bacterium RIFCSPHIGHO2_02_FULL_40_17]OGE05475.1 MAG: hypothetical protein A3F45_03800 [Candidatus Curtissbacteria bacterium RIFCSPHIGHO2_12_FULL_41_17]OGE07123.1 MAG: hypothetical protein A3I53_02900 [Candidatus Curtissbacteria bacterium RIFCSPLOWO2_02_FULL_40_13b]
MASPEVIERIRQQAVKQLPGLVTEEGYPASAEGRFRNAIFTRDYCTFGLLALEKPQNGELPIILEGIKTSLETSARHQGMKYDPTTCETPCEMPHEMHGETSNQERLAEIKRNGGPVIEINGHLEMITYWARDVNGLWNSLFSRYVLLTGDWTFRDKLWSNLEASVRWLAEEGDIDGDLLIEGPHNQWWKDSETSLVDEQGRMPLDPVATLDVNSFAYLSDILSADLYESKGNLRMAQMLRERALERRRLINKLFWIEDFGLYAPAIDAAKKPISIQTSDSVFPLWVGIPDSQRAERVVARLVQPDLLTMWGLRTRSRHSTKYDPGEYQNGNVWFQLAAIAAAGCERYGLTQEAVVFDDCVYRTSSELGFPELSEVDDQNNVFPYRENGVPVACNPQTWVIGGVLNRTASR